MTKATRKALKALKIPTVQWSNTASQFYARIGYRRSRSGTRQRAFHYLGRDESAAVLRAATLKDQWRQVKRQGGVAAVWSNRMTAPAVDLMKLTPEQQQAAVDEFQEEQRIAALDGGVQQQVPRFRVEKVRRMYLDYRETKLGIVGGKGVNGRSLGVEQRTLTAATAANADRFIDTFDYDAVESWKDDIFRRVGKSKADGAIGKRTANNYWASIGRMLKWAHDSRVITYNCDERTMALLRDRFQNANNTKIVPYNADVLKTLLATATDWQRLIVYLSLNCGHYAVDVGTMRADEIRQHKGVWEIVRKRSKTEHQNDFLSQHVLWEETAKLAQKLRAQQNKLGLAFLSETTTPLYDRNGRFDLVSATYNALRKRARRAHPTTYFPSLKQFRKMGSTAIQRLGGDECRRLYKAGTIDSGDKVYVLEAREKLTAPLLEWGAELRADGVLTLP